VPESKVHTCSERERDVLLLYILTDTLIKLKGVTTLSHIPLYLWLYGKQGLYRHITNSSFSFVMLVHFK